MAPVILCHASYGTSFNIRRFQMVDEKELTKPVTDEVVETKEDDEIEATDEEDNEDDGEVDEE